MSINIEIGKLIRFYRLEKNLNMHTLAKAIGFKSASTIYYLESGLKEIRVSELILIAKVLGLSVNKLIPNTNEEFYTTAS